MFPWGMCVEGSFHIYTYIIISEQFYFLFQPVLELNKKQQTYNIIELIEYTNLTLNFIL